MNLHSWPGDIAGLQTFGEPTLGVLRGRGNFLK